MELSLCKPLSLALHDLPHYRLFKAGDAYYGGEFGAQAHPASREARSIVAFALLHLRSPVQLVGDANFGPELARALSAAPLAVILFSAKRATPSIYKALASSLSPGGDAAFLEVRTGTGGHEQPLPAHKVLAAYQVDTFPTMILQIGSHALAKKVRYDPAAAVGAAATATAASTTTTAATTNGGEAANAGWNDLAAMQAWVLHHAFEYAKQHDATLREYKIKTPSLFPQRPTLLQLEQSTLQQQQQPSQQQHSQSQHPATIPLVDAPRSHPELVSALPVHSAVAETAPVTPAGSSEGSLPLSEVRASPPHAHVVLDVVLEEVAIVGHEEHPGLEFEFELEALPELADRSCLRSFCNNPALDPQQRKPCLILVLYPSAMNSNSNNNHTTTQAKHIVKQVETTRTNNMFTFGQLSNSARCGVAEERCDSLTHWRCSLRLCVVVCC